MAGTVEAKIYSYIRANLNELVKQEKADGKPLTYDGVMTLMMQNGSATQADWNAYHNEARGKMWEGNDVSCLKKFTEEIMTGGGSISNTANASKTPSARQTAMNKSAKENAVVSNTLYSTIKEARDIIANYRENPDIKNRIAQNGHYVLEQFGASKSVETVLKEMDELLAATSDLKSRFSNDKYFAFKFTDITGQPFDKAAVEEFTKIADASAQQAKFGISGVTDNAEKYTKAFAAVFGPKITSIVQNAANFVKEREDNALRDAVGTAIGYFVFGAIAKEAAGASATAKVATATPVAAVACKDGSDDVPRSDINNTLVAFQINIMSTDSLAVAIEKLTQVAKSQEFTLNALLDAFNKFQTKFDAKCDDDKDFHDQVIKLLQAINTGIQKLPSEFQTYFTDMLNAIGANGEKLDEIIKLLNVLNNNAEKINTSVKDATERLLAALKNLDYNMTTGMTAILSAITKNGASLEAINAAVARIENMVGDLKQLTIKYGESGTILGNAILAAIGKLDFRVDVDLSGVEAMLKELSKGQQKIDANISNLSANIQQIGTNIINKIPKSAPDYSKQLQTIISLLSSINPGAVDLSKLEQLLGQVVSGVNNNTDLLKNISHQNDVILDLLKSFKADVGRKLDGFEAWYQKIYEKIPEGGTNTYNIDLNGVLYKLDEILNAIKKIPTTDKITVDITGQVTCQCNCGGGSSGGEVHEGVLGNLEGILG